MSMRSGGFTLLEVLIALAILAVSATSIVRQTGNSLTQLSQLEATTTANLLAESQLDRLTASDMYPATGRASEGVSANGREWIIRTQISATSEPWLRKIEVSVSEQSADDQPLAILVGYKGRY